MEFIVHLGDEPIAARAVSRALEGRPPADRALRRWGGGPPSPAAAGRAWGPPGPIPEPDGLPVERSDGMVGRELGDGRGALPRRPVMVEVGGEE